MSGRKSGLMRYLQRVVSAAAQNILPLLKDLGIQHWTPLSPARWQDANLGNRYFCCAGRST